MSEFTAALYMNVTLTLVDSKSLLKEFIFLPEKIYKGDA